MNNAIQSCMKCGTCTASCPSGRVVAFRTRELVEKRACGEMDYDDLSLWYCTTCFNCMERCPRGIDITEEILKIRQEAYRLGKVLESHKAVLGYIYRTGHAVPINDRNRERRKELGLDELPPTTHSFEGARDEVRKLMGEGHE
ncbi:MAG TPA: CoB--CoM heterodisulfide reductase subunit C [Candidatus Methanofastidiosa archaeon]|nr:CoB--CoM heterodisulfide reductase subunit C [Candidatus Methanofastidiosa archaeon]HPR42548.1 CoB--CoM heterodisulfide reductase subunit C [Candidatus Methanofastidiosa archaeon]